MNSKLPSHKDKIVVAALGDIHVRETSRGKLINLLTEISQKAKLLLLAADLTDHGWISEAKILKEELRSCSIPVVGVLGNHDYEANEQEEIRKVLTDDHVSILDGENIIYDNVGIAGIKGFCGGFDQYMLAAWGEPVIKQFVYDTVNEALKLEKALAELETEKKIALLHYAPIKETCEGEACEVIPFVGSSRLSDPINRIGADIVIHGHTHFGTLQGKTSKNIPVYNVSSHVLHRQSPPKNYLLIDV